MVIKEKSQVGINDRKFPLREAAPMLGRSEKTLRNWTAAGRLAVLNIRGRVFVPESEILRILGESFIPSRDAA